MLPKEKREENQGEHSGGSLSTTRCNFHLLLGTQGLMMAPRDLPLLTSQTLSILPLLTPSSRTNSFSFLKYSPPCGGAVNSV